MKTNLHPQTQSLEPVALQPRPLKADPARNVPDRLLLPHRKLPLLVSAAARLLCAALFCPLVPHLQARQASESAPLDAWHWRMPLPQGNNLTAITYGNGLYASVGEGDQVVWSTDAVHWASCALSVARGLRGYWDVATAAVRPSTDMLRFCGLSQRLLSNPQR